MALRRLLALAALLLAAGAPASADIMTELSSSFEDTIADPYDPSVNGDFYMYVKQPFFGGDDDNPVATWDWSSSAAARNGNKGLLLNVAQTSSEGWHVQFMVSPGFICSRAGACVCCTLCMLSACHRQAASFKGARGSDRPATAFGHSIGWQEHLP